MIDNRLLEMIFCRCNMNIVELAPKAKVTAYAWRTKQPAHENNQPSVRISPVASTLNSGFLRLAVSAGFTSPAIISPLCCNREGNMIHVALRWSSFGIMQDVIPLRSMLHVKQDSPGVCGS